MTNDQVQQLLSKIKRITFHLIPSHYDRESFIQEVFLKFWERDEVDPFFISIKNALIDLIRKEKKHLSFEFLPQEAITNETPLEEPSPFIEELLSPLTPYEKTIIYLRMHEDMTYAQIAGYIGVETRRISYLLEKIRSKLFEHLVNAQSSTHFERTL